MYVGHGSYGKARYVSNKFSKLLGDFEDSKAQPHDIGIQTDRLSSSHGQQPPRSEWANAHETFMQRQDSNNPSIYANNVTYVDENIPPVTTEQTLQCLDIVSFASYDLYYNKSRS